MTSSKEQNKKQTHLQIRNTEANVQMETKMIFPKEKRAVPPLGRTDLHFNM